MHDSLFKCEPSLIKLLLLIVKEESHNMLSWFCHTSVYVITSDSVFRQRINSNPSCFYIFFMIKMLLKMILKRLLLNCVDVLINLGKKLQPHSVVISKVFFIISTGIFKWPCFHLHAVWQYYIPAFFSSV